MALLALGAGTASPIHAALLRPDRSLSISIYISSYMYSLYPHGLTRGTPLSGPGSPSLATSG